MCQNCYLLPFAAAAQSKTLIGPLAGGLEVGPESRFATEVRSYPPPTLPGLSPGVIRRFPRVCIPAPFPYIS